MYKYIIAVLFLLVGVTMTPQFVDAKESPQPRGRNEEKKAEVQQTVQEKKEDKVQEFQAQREKVTENHADRLEFRFKKYAERLTMIAEKVQDRINKREAEGQDNGSAQEKLDEAKASLQSAIELGQEAVALFRAIEPAKYPEQRDQALKARDKAQQARAAFVQTVKLLTQAIQEMSDEVETETSTKTE